MAATTSSSSSHLIIDTDVGFDDLLAIHCLLQAGHTNDNKECRPLITTVGGCISASRGAAAVKQLLSSTNSHDDSHKDGTAMPNCHVAVGLDSPVMPYDPTPEWLDHYRSTSLDAFLQQWNTGTNGRIDNHPQNNSSNHSTKKEKDGLSCALEYINNAPDNSVSMICLGPLTNLAHWLNHYEKHHAIRALACKIRHIFILGGNHPKVDLHAPEFNFGLDPEAARTVLECSHLHDKLHLVTTSVCNVARLRSALGGEHLKDFIQDQKSRTNKNNKSTFYGTLLQFDEMACSLSCDNVCARAMKHPTSVEWETVAVQVETPSGKLLPVIDHDDDKQEGAVIRIASSIDLKGYVSWVKESLA